MRPGLLGHGTKVIRDEPIPFFRYTKVMERYRGSRRGHFHRQGARPRRGAKPDEPMLLGEPSPSLARINMMNMVKLEAKIEQLVEEQSLVSQRLERLTSRDPVPTDQVERTREQLNRLVALEKAARERLELKTKRKAEWEKKNLGPS